jgi:hypothetical protein
MAKLLGLEESGVQAVMCGLEQVHERGGLRLIGGGEPAAPLENAVQRRVPAELHLLPLVRTHDAEADRGGDHAAERHEEAEPLHRGAFQP